MSWMLGAGGSEFSDDVRFGICGIGRLRAGKIEDFFWP